MDKTISSMVGVIPSSSNTLIFATDEEQSSSSVPSSPSDRRPISVQPPGSRRMSSNAKASVYRHQRFNSIPKVAITSPPADQGTFEPSSYGSNSDTFDDDFALPQYPIPRAASPQISISSDASNKRSSFYAHQNSSNPVLGSGMPILAPPAAPFVSGDMRGSSPPSRSSSPVFTNSLPKQNPDSGPFNFQSTVAGGSPTVRKGNASQRRGHRYKHSSVSMNFFQEPPARAPLPIPESLPIPTFSECIQSMSREQRVQAAWCGLHFAVCYLVYNCDMPFTAIQSLAHLLFYDALGATLCVAVDVLSNFDVWKKSSIHHPFGLQRIEVLAGFAIAVTLIFMGGDIMSHALQDMIQSLYALPGEHTHIHSHGKEIHNHANSDVTDFHDSLGWFSMVVRIILGIVVTLVSAIGLDNHSRINVSLKRAVAAPIVNGRSQLSEVLSNPCHIMTLTFSFALLLFPLMGVSGYRFVDTLLTPLIAVSMCYVGWNLAKALGGMLVMSYPGEDHIEEIEQSIRRASPLVASVSNVSLWQVHHGLWLASMKIVMSGTDDDEQSLRQTAAQIVKSTMGEATDEATWQTTIDITRTTLYD